MKIRGEWLRVLSVLLIGGLALSGCGVLRQRNRQGQPSSTPQPAAATVTSAPAATEAATAAEATTTPTTLPTATEALATLEPTVTPPPTEPAIVPLSFVIGRNDYLINLENVPRKLLVYVPAGYDPNRPTPVVIMYHGSNQGGQLMYENTGWAAKADQENFIVAFPTSWKYRTLEANQIEDKWNTIGMFKQVVPGTELKDDVLFTRVIVDTLDATFNVDAHRLYATGFSNGGGFVLTRLVLQANDLFAAFATSGAGLGGADTADVTLPTGINASVYSVLGSNDEKISEGTGHARPFPMVAEEIAADPLFGMQIGNLTTVLSLDPAYEVQYDKPWFTTMTYHQSLVGADNQYIFRMVNNMGHVYPSGNNNRAGLNVADDFWAFFSLYAKP